MKICDFPYDIIAQVKLEVPSFFVKLHSRSSDLIVDNNCESNLNYSDLR